ncbi:uncharacterized protein [Triticum aestivum]|uniref:uncharacterized protein isoform X2 n=1 Tax=Triticum aestivum TaxID=4565 RepID=UPI001D01431B|nr:uncharacterized protein LOC123092052 isoform X2 [Triticum aestivum]
MGGFGSCSVLDMGAARAWSSKPWQRRKVPRDLIDGGITIWSWIIHFCSISNVVFVWNGQFSISKSAILYFLSGMIYFSTIQALGAAEKRVSTNVPKLMDLTTDCCIPMRSWDNSDMSRCPVCSEGRSQSCSY